MVCVPRPRGSRTPRLLRPPVGDAGRSSTRWPSRGKTPPKTRRQEVVRPRRFFPGATFNPLPAPAPCSTGVPPVNKLPRRRRIPNLKPLCKGSRARRAARGAGSWFLVSLTRYRRSQTTLCSQTSGHATRGHAKGLSGCRRRPPATALSPVLVTRAAGAQSREWRQARGVALLTAPAAHPGAGQGSNPDHSRPRVGGAGRRSGGFNPRLWVVCSAAGRGRGNDPAQRLRARAAGGLECKVRPRPDTVDPRHPRVECKLLGRRVT